MFMEDRRHHELLALPRNCEAGLLRVAEPRSLVAGGRDWASRPAEVLALLGIEGKLP